MTGSGRYLIATVVALTACRSGPQVVTPPVPEPDSASVQARVFLIGDAGAPKPGDPVLEALAAEVRSGTAPATVVFLGDNV